jgi:hypothetical protein
VKRQPRAQRAIAVAGDRCSARSAKKSEVVGMQMHARATGTEAPHRIVGEQVELPLGKGQADRDALPVAARIVGAQPGVRPVLLFGGQRGRRRDERLRGADEDTGERPDEH